MSHCRPFLNNEQIVPEGDLSIYGHRQASHYGINRSAMKTSLLLLLPHLFLPKDDDPPGFDGVPSGQVVASSQLPPVLVSVPLAVPCGPRDADVVPHSIPDLQWQLGNLIGS